MKNKKRIIVGLSAESIHQSLLLCLLNKVMRLLAFSMRNWSGDSGRTFFCSWTEGRTLEDARRVAQLLGIPFLCLEFWKRIRKKLSVIFFANIKPAGICTIRMWCVTEKSNLNCFWKKPWNSAPITFAPDTHSSFIAAESIIYYAVRIRIKIQSYFLCTLTQKELSKSLFPKLVNIPNRRFAFWQKNSHLQT